MKPKRDKAKDTDEKKPPLTREGFFKTLQKVTKPVPRPTDQGKSKTGK
jgi:hypothetical protein